MCVRLYIYNVYDNKVVPKRMSYGRGINASDVGTPARPLCTTGFPGCLSRIHTKGDETRTMMTRCR